METSHELIACGNSSMTCVHSFSEYALSISFVPGTVVVAGFTLNKKGEDSTHRSLYSSEELKHNFTETKLTN